MSEALQKIQDSLLKFGFLKTVGPNLFENFSFGPLANLLADNIRREWLNSNVMASELNTVLYNSHPNNPWHVDCQTSYNEAFKKNCEKLPFGLGSVSANYLPFVLNENRNNTCVDLSSKTKIYRHLIFISQQDSQQYFYRLQRQHKFWWRKYSTDPERFYIEDVKDDKSQEAIQITARFPWTSYVLETISCHGNQPLLQYGNLFEVKVGRKKVLPHVIESVCLESSALLTYLFDAHQHFPARTMLQLHHSLTPYKVTVLIDSPGDKSDDLNDLMKFLIFSLQKAGLHTLQEMNAFSNGPLKSQLHSCDNIGVMYTVLIRPQALVNGIVGLRSRDTTLEEQVHVSKLTSYLQQLVNK